MKTIKAIYNKISAFCNRYNPKAITSMIIFLLDDIKAIQITIKTMREEYESLKTYHNNLSIDYRDNSASKLDLLELKNRVDVLAIANELKKDKKAIYKDSAKTSLLNTPFKDELTKPSKNIDDNIIMLENILKSIIETKVNNACLLVQYGADITLDKEPYDKYSIKEILQHYIKNDDNHLFRLYNKGIDKIASLERVNKQYERLLTSDNNYILEEIAKVLIPYENEDNLQFYKINDIIDDINDRFNEFNNIYNDVCDINSNQRKVKND